jgi:hypothetical protein
MPVGELVLSCPAGYAQRRSAELTAGNSPAAAAAASGECAEGASAERLRRHCRALSRHCAAEFTRLTPCWQRRLRDDYYRRRRPGSTAAAAAAAVGADDDEGGDALRAATYITIPANVHPASASTMR